MKKFLRYVALFIIPILSFLACLEILVHTIPNSYKYKYDYVRANGASIKAIAIGHSQFYDDFKSSSFYLPSFNLSNSAQGYMEDYYILEELLPSLPNLEMVILPIGYLNVGREEKFTYRSCYYYEYMHINYDGQLPLEYHFECFNIRSSIKKVYSYYINHEDIVGCDSLGCRKHELSQKKDDVFSNVMASYTLNKGDNMFFAGERYFRNIIRLLTKNDIRVVLVSPPYCWGSCEYVNHEQKEWVKNYIRSVCEDFPMLAYLDLEDDKQFIKTDFNDASHLNAVGSEKFVKKLNLFINVESNLINDCDE